MTATISATIIDSAIFRDIFSTEAMRRVFADASRVQKYLDFEAALAKAQARLGIIPPQAADEIVHHCDAGEIDFVKLKTRPSASATRSCRWCSNSSRSAAPGTGSGAIGARPRRT